MQIFKQPFLLDGATGTNLYLAGMPGGVCVEKWILDHPEPLMQLQREYIRSGSNAVMAPTFGANRVSLKSYGYEDKAGEFIRTLVGLSRKAADGTDVLVAGNMSPAGVFIRPYGDATFDELTDVFREQAFALKGAGVDYIALETFMNLTEARAALLAARETGLPATATITVAENGKTMSGGDVLANLTTLAAMGAAAVGLNCSTGPETVYRALEGCIGKIPVPLIAKPNLGVPQNGTGRVSDAEFSRYAGMLLEAGVGILGGCCGTGPRHIAILRGLTPHYRPVRLAEDPAAFAANERQAFPVDLRNIRFSPEIPVDEDLAETVSGYGDEGYDCALIRIKDEKQAEEFGECLILSLPVCLVCDEEAALETAAKLYQGRCLVRADDEPKVHNLRQIAAKYGCICIRP